MSRPSDFFGAAPKTVLNKPFFHAQDQKAYNVDGGTVNNDTWETRPLNTVLYNDLQGASLSNNQVSLPAGVYYIEGSASFVQDVSSGVLLALYRGSSRVAQGLTNPNTGSHSVGKLTTISGVVTLTTADVISLKYYSGSSLASFGLGYSNTTSGMADTTIPSIYADLKIWRLDASIEYSRADGVGGEPVYLSKPFSHFQDRKAYNVDGGTSIADAWTKRDLNYTVKSDIVGANLANNEISLPAGTYYVEGLGTFYNGAGASTFLLSVFNGSNLIVRQNISPYFGAAGGRDASVSGVFTLASPGVISLQYHVGVAQATYGLGLSNSGGSIVDATIPSIYADLKIWQLDRSLEIAPVAVNSGLQTVPGLNTEGHVMGFDSFSTGNVITVGKGSCLDSTLTVPIAFTDVKTVTIPGTINQDFFIFAVRLLDGVTFQARAYTALAGPSSDVQIDKWGLVSYCKNDPSGVVRPFAQFADKIKFITSSKPTFVGSVTASFVSLNVSAILPVSIIKEYTVWTSLTNGIDLSSAGTTADLGSTFNSITSCPIPPLSTLYVKWFQTGTSWADIWSITLRR